MRWLMVWPDSHTINSFLLFPAASLLFAFVTETHPSHLKATVFSLVSIHLSLFFLFALLLRLSSDPCIHLVSSQPSLSLPLSLSIPPPSAGPAQPPLRYSQSHQQSHIFNGLITLSSVGLIEHLTSTAHLLWPLVLPPHLRPLTALAAFFSPSFHLVNSPSSLSFFSFLFFSDFWTSTSSLNSSPDPTS